MYVTAQTAVHAECILLFQELETFLIRTERHIEVTLPRRRDLLKHCQAQFKQLGLQFKLPLAIDVRAIVPAKLRFLPNATYSRFLKMMNLQPDD
jgi:hypothetical protein